MKNNFYSAIESIEFKITVKFTSGDDVTKSKKVNINCSGELPPEPKAGEYLLSNAGESFLDPDARKTYKAGELTTAAIKEGVVVVAYQNSTAGDKFWNACNTTGTNAIGEAACGTGRLFKTEKACKDGNPVDGEMTIDVGAVNATFYIEGNSTDVFKATITWKGSQSVMIKLDPVAFECN